MGDEKASVEGAGCCLVEVFVLEPRTRGHSLQLPSVSLYLLPCALPGNLRLVFPCKPPHLTYRACRLHICSHGSANHNGPFRVLGHRGDRDQLTMITPSTTPPLRPRLLYLPSHLRFALRVGILAECTFSAIVKTRANARSNFRHSTEHPSDQHAHKYAMQLAQVQQGDSNSGLHPPPSSVHSRSSNRLNDHPSVHVHSGS